MNLYLDLPAELEAKLTSEAKRRGVPLKDYALSLLAAGCVADTAPKTGVELIAYWQKEGVIGSRPDISDSLHHAHELRRRAVYRER